MLWLLLPLLWAGSLAQDERFQLQVQESVIVQEGLCISVPCNVSYPQEGWTPSTPAYGFWFREEPMFPGILTATNNRAKQVQEEYRGRFHLLGDPRNYRCSLDIRDARMKDTGVYYFRLERGDTAKYNFLTRKLNVRVTALSHTPDIIIPGTLESGRPMNLTCSVPWACERGTPPLFSWMSAAPTSLGPRTNFSSVLTLTPQPQDHGTSLTCNVTLPGARVTTMRTIQLNVSYPPQNLMVTIFEGNGTAPRVLQNGSCLVLLEGQSLRLVCEVDSNPPARLSWSRGSQVLDSSKPGVLELTGIPNGDGRELTCQAQNTQGSLHISLNLLLPGSRWPLSGVTLGALLGTGVSTLLFLFCIVVFMVKFYGKKATRTVEGTGDTSTEGTVEITRTISQGPLTKSQPDSFVDPSPSALAVPSSEEKEEIQYASLNFHQMKPRSPQEQEVVTENEYSEIKISK